MAVFNEPTKWQTSLVNSGDANVIPQSTPVGTGKASFDDGFPQITQIPLSAGGQAPDRKDFNGLFKVLGDWIFFNQNGGVSTYSENFDYVAGRVVSYNDNIYKCIQANGVSSTVVTPDSDTAYWQQLDNFVRSVNGVTADISGNVQLGNIGAITGEIKWFAFNTPPDGYLACNGATVSRTTYADLFAIIGTTFGSGDGSTTFGLPNLIDKFPQGSTTVGTYKSAGLPDHTHTYVDSFAVYSDGHGGDYPLCSTHSEYSHRTTERASESNSIYGNSSTVQPPALTLLPCIKY